MEIGAVLRELAADLDAPVGVDYSISPDGRRVAITERPVASVRPKAPILVLYYGPISYDVTRRAVPASVPRTGRLVVCDTIDGTRSIEQFDSVAGEPVWSADGRWLAGLTPAADEGYRVWVLDAASGERWMVGPRVGFSLLRAVADGIGRAWDGQTRIPLWWTGDGDLVVARDAIDRTAIDPRDDIVAEPGRPTDRTHDGSELEYHHDLMAIAAAARVDLVAMDRKTGSETQVLRAGCVVADCQPNPAGTRLLAGVANGPDDVRELLAGKTVGYEVYSFATGGRQDGRGGIEVGGVTRRRELGRRPVGAMCWPPGAGETVLAAERIGTDIAFGFLSAVTGLEVAERITLPGPVSSWLPTHAGVFAATTGSETATGCHGRLVLAVPASPPRTLELPSALIPNSCRLRVVPSVESLPGRMMVAVTGVGSNGERLLAVDHSEQSTAVQYLPGPTEDAGRVAFVGERMMLVVRYGAETWSLVRCAHNVSVVDDRVVVHRLAVPAPRAVPRSDCRADGRLSPWVGYRLCLPSPESLDPAGASLLVDLCPLPEDAPLPEPTPSTMRLPLLRRSALAAGHAVATLHLRLPLGRTNRFADIGDRLVDGVAALRTELVGERRVDLERSALCGHSFGAACAAVVLASAPDWFRCAILRAGAYNRTLTPRGFQDEHRDLWQVRDVYDGFTLAYHAPSIRCPVLILQGSADINGVTDALQAWSFYDTVLAAGGHARMVLLYNEGHAFTTREGLLTAAREELTWLDRWTRPPPR
ncbi:alpha/beta hydrolase family protein [Nocardia transvalensis]|uniref:alpha/beta hydrolase family protein n=1 Tax=Nocardia transvalensis TaxID=37333 RepID=UPI001892F50B|nr:prolyl oligopeptidase family serine peptidase [Nocardia transvalensis]MBF6331072.1 prolyl oligopeptidase family serine peptidase [Nocardia transvalensis]